MDELRSDVLDGERTVDEQKQPLVVFRVNYDAFRENRECGHPAFDWDWWEPWELLRLMRWCAHFCTTDPGAQAKALHKA